MPPVYTTQDLIDILAKERLSCLRGERLNLSAAQVVHPLLDRLIDPAAVQKFSAYKGFKAVVHQYQREHQVSGIIWWEISDCDRTLIYPIVHEELLAIPQDVELLKSHKSRVVDFWQGITSGMEFHLSICHGKDFQPVSPQLVNALVDRSEWATIHRWANPNFRQVVLQLGVARGCDDPHDQSCHLFTEDIYGVDPGQRPIG